MFPMLNPLWNFLGLELFPEKPMDFFADIVRRIIELRKEGGKNEVRERKRFLMTFSIAKEWGYHLEKL